ncbi:MAG: polysaccharide biosynthesis C-terminal domain-containing protein, partial [Acidobacteriaceae bacterium]
VNMGADVPLILKYGAVGAAIGNGIGQGIGVSLIWIVAARYFSLRISWNAQARFLATALVPAIAGFVLTDILPPVIGIAAAIVALIVLYFLCLRLFRPFEFEDSPRLRFLADRFPARFRGIAWKLLKLGVKTPQNTGPAEVFPSAIG